MTELQQSLLNIFEWFHNFCEKEKLTYFAVGGTALGAVRHNGFIPWDDDIDVAMPRKDYERFLEMTKNTNKFKPYVVESPSEKKDFVYPYSKIYDTTTTLIENTCYHTKRGIYIDVFPIDGMGNTMEESIKNFKVVKKEINLLCTRVCALRGTRKWYKNAAILLARCVPDCILSSLKIIKKIDRLSKRYDYDKCDFVANICGNWGEKEIMEKKWVGKRKLLKFEELNIYVPENYDAYLSRMYGDYMQLPPEEKRCTHHDFLFLDLNKSYLE